MDIGTAVLPRTEEDQVSNALKWVLRGIAVVIFVLLGWATDITYRTYRTAPPQPDRFVAADGRVLLTAQDVVEGKVSFQHADLMDYGSIYGMGSYFGEDYTAEYLVRLGQLTENVIAQQRFGKPLSALSTDDQRVAQAYGCR